jgi:hypothetical protein
MKALALIAIGALGGYLLARCNHCAARDGLSGPWGGGYQGIDWNGVYLHNADNVLHKLEHIAAVRSGAIDWRNDAAGAAKVQMYQPYLNEPIFSDVPERRWYE